MAENDNSNLKLGFFKDTASVAIFKIVAGAHSNLKLVFNLKLARW